MRNLATQILGEQDCCEKPMIKQLSVSQTLQENLQRSKLSLETRLREVNDALEAIDKNPELIKFLEVIAKAR